MCAVKIIFLTGTVLISLCAESAYNKMLLNYILLIISYLFVGSFQVPYNVAFKNKTSEDVSLLVVDSIVDVIFFIDIGEYQ